MDSMPALGALLAPRPLDDFFEAFWPDKAPWFLAEGDPARLPAFLRSAELESIERLARVNKGPAWASNGAKSSYMMPIDKRAAESAYKMGLTLYLENVTGDIPGAREFLRQLESDLGLVPNSIRVTAWASPSESGAACHYDTSDVISIQLRGTKRFELAPMQGLANPVGRPYSPGATHVADEVFPQMGDGFPEWADAAFEELEMTPGSVLMFRRGTWHRTHAGSDSLAVSLIIEPPLAADCVLRALRAVMLQDPRWRRPVYGAWGGGEGRSSAHREIAALLERLPQVARAVTPRDVALATMPEEQRLAAIDGESRFQRIPHATVTCKAEDGAQAEVGLVWMGEDGTEEERASLTVPRAGLEVMRWIAAQDAPFRADDVAARFPEVPFKGLRQMLEVSARCGLVKLLWFPDCRDPA